MFKCYIFDMDGTLLDSLYYWRYLIRFLLAEKGIKSTYEDEEHVRSTTMYKGCQSILRKYGYEYTEAELDEYAHKLSLEYYRTNVSPKPYAEQFLQFLKNNGCRICIATATEYETAHKAMEYSGLLKYIDFFCACSVVGKSKSYPDVYTECAKHFNLSIKDCVVFEDNWRCIKTAREAGFYVVGVWDRISTKEQIENGIRYSNRYIYSYDTVPMCVRIETLGCKVNQYESDCIEDELLKEGFWISHDDEEPDIYVINTCSVTHMSDNKSKKLIRRCLRQKEQRPEIIIAVCGCHVENEQNDALLNDADIVCGNTGKSQIAKRIKDKVMNRSYKRSEIYDLPNVYENMTLTYTRNTRAFVKIEDGCNNFCSYCIVPYVRGRVRCRDEQSILTEVYRLGEKGYSEVVLIGIELTGYGNDNLLALIRHISVMDNIKRIRMGSLRPDIFTEEFLQTLSSYSKVMPHFHISAQSGASSVLKRMNRKYSSSDILSAFERIYRYFPDCTLSADIIIGFPGETDEDFEATALLVKKGRLLHTHIFPYSVRKGTPAADMEQVNINVKKERAKELERIGKAVSEDMIKGYIGKECNILVEKLDEKYSYGYTENYLYIRAARIPEDYIGRIRKATVERIERETE